MSLEQAKKFLKKSGHKKRTSKYEPFKEEIVYLYSEGASLEIITQYLETKGIERTKGVSGLSQYIKRNLVDDIIKMKSEVKETELTTQTEIDDNPISESKSTDKKHDQDDKVNKKSGLQMIESNVDPNNGELKRADRSKFI